MIAFSVPNSTLAGQPQLHVIPEGFVYVQNPRGMNLYVELRVSEGGAGTVTFSGRRERGAMYLDPGFEYRTEVSEDGGATWDRESSAIVERIAPPDTQTIDSGNPATLRVLFNPRYLVRGSASAQYRFVILSDAGVEYWSSSVSIPRPDNALKYEWED